jgi:transposase
MATVAGVRSNPAVRTFYKRLRPNGKHAKPALVACMRKFLIILNAS